MVKLSEATSEIVQVETKFTPKKKGSTKVRKSRADSIFIGTILFPYRTNVSIWYQW